MEVIPCRDRDRAVALTALLVEMRLREQPDLVLGLATGRTMEGVYERLVASGVSFAQCTTFNLDEYVGLPPDHPNSYASYMRHHLFDHVNIDPARAHLPDGMAEDLAQAAADYEDKIAAAGGIDIQILGIGNTGHIGFNEPVSAFCSRTRDKVLAPETRTQNSGIFAGDSEAVPKRALTMGVGTILDSREVMLLASGAAKARVVAKAIEGPVTSRISASAIQFHSSCKVILDDEASAELEDLDYYRFIFQTEEKWEGLRHFVVPSAR